MKTLTTIQDDNPSTQYWLFVLTDGGGKDMSYWVETGTCGNCKYFEYVGEYEKGYCSW